MGYINSDPDVYISFEISCSRSALIDLIGSIGYLILYSDCRLVSEDILRPGYDHSVDLLNLFKHELQDVLDSVNENLGEF